ncbi:jg19973 [Pararge aegeria aegeria]|uniref:Jg19973 protein n=1 Tax=Pararge aegeria aegeria TaxID=348720 RepID=A0A8S4RYC8_9NEOP|nr:jg19973 [Pararge aegeria aegeria]
MQAAVVYCVVHSGSEGERRRPAVGSSQASERALPPFSQLSSSGARTPHAVLARGSRRYARAARTSPLMRSLPVAALLGFTNAFCCTDITTRSASNHVSIVPEIAATEPVLCHAAGAGEDVSLAGHMAASPQPILGTPPRRHLLHIYGLNAPHIKFTRERRLIVINNLTYLSPGEAH